MKTGTRCSSTSSIWVSAVLCQLVHTGDGVVFLLCLVGEAGRALDLQRHGFEFILSDGDSARPGKSGIDVAGGDGGGASAEVAEGLVRRPVPGHGGEVRRHPDPDHAAEGPAGCDDVWRRASTFLAVEGG